MYHLCMTEGVPRSRRLIEFGTTRAERVCAVVSDINRTERNECDVCVSCMTCHMPIDKGGVFLDGTTQSLGTFSVFVDRIRPSLSPVSRARKVSLRENTILMWRQRR